MAGESADDVVERCEEVLDWKVPGEAAGVSDAEAPAVPGASVGGGGGGRKGAGPGAAGNSGKRGKSGAAGGSGSEGKEADSSSSSINNYAMGAGVALITAALSIVALDELELYDFY